MRGRSYSPSPPRGRKGRSPSPSPRGRFTGRGRDPSTSLLVRNLRHDYLKISAGRLVSLALSRTFICRGIITSGVKMYGSQFDGNAAFSGGGFMPSQATQSTVDNSSSFSKSRDTQGLVPLTVKQINEALLSSNDSSHFGVDGVEVSTVTLVGRVCEKTENVTEVCFFLDDGTGRINVHRWVNEPFSNNEMANIPNGMYVRVHASLKAFQGKRQLLAFSVRPMTDFNELTYHFLECMYAHMYNTKLRATSVSAEPQMMTSVNGTLFRGLQGLQ